MEGFSEKPARPIRCVVTHEDPEMPVNDIPKTVPLVLKRCWTEVPPAFHVYSPIAARLLPMALRGGVIPLIASQMGQLDNLPGKLRRRYQQVSQLQMMRTAQNELRIPKVFQALQSHNIEPILIKGWSVARHYADPLKRSQMDIDICVQRDQLQAAEEVIARLEFPPGAIDLHGGIDDLSDRGWNSVFRRTQTVDLHGCEVRLLCDEDLLRLVCLHFWRHRCNRAVWLCDVAAFIENRNSDFDWDLCFSGRRHDTEKVRVSIALAVKLLDARLDEHWVGDAVHRLPEWLIQSVTARWAEDFDQTQTTPWEKFNAFDPIRTVNRLPIGPYHSEQVINWLTYMTMPIVLAARAIRDVSRTWKTPSENPVAIHRKVVS